MCFVCVWVWVCMYVSLDSFLLQESIVEKTELNMAQEVRVVAGNVLNRINLLESLQNKCFEFS